MFKTINNASILFVDKFQRKPDTIVLTLSSYLQLLKESNWVQRIELEVDNQILGMSFFVSDGNDKEENKFTLVSKCCCLNFYFYNE